jgi:hypothetical protein
VLGRALGVVLVVRRGVAALGVCLGWLCPLWLVMSLGLNRLQAAENRLVE